MTTNPVTLRVAAEHFHVAYDALYDAMRRGALPTTKPGRDHLVYLQDVQQYLDSRPDRWQQEQEQDR